MLMVIKGGKWSRKTQDGWGDTKTLKNTEISEYFKVKMFVCKIGAYFGGKIGAFFTRLSGGSVFFRRIERRFQKTKFSKGNL